MIMIITIISVIVAILITFLFCRFIPGEKIKQINQEIIKQEQELQLKIKDKENDYNNLINKFNQEKQLQESAHLEDMRKWEQEKNDKNISFLKAEMQLKENIASLEASIEEKKKSFSELNFQTKEAIKALEERTYDLMTNEMESSGQQAINNYQLIIKQSQKEYEQILSELVMNYQIKIAENETNYQIYLNQLEEAKAKAIAITESNKRAQLEREAKDFYKLQLTDLDIEEIEKIRSIEPYLRNKEPLNKVIWKVYYEKPYNDLIGRVVGNKKKIGIYKITHIDSGKTYIGQSLDIAERWRQHIKRGVGADQPTQNKLYPAMLQYGAENFMFEVLEECQAIQLSEREKYYQSIYGAQEFGYSMK